jgi:hypothetical protein
VVVVVGLTETAVPLVAVRLPGVITPAPPVKTPVNPDGVPAATEAGLAVKLVMAGAATTVTVVMDVIGVPVAGVTVSV